MYYLSLLTLKRELTRELIKKVKKMYESMLYKWKWMMNINQH